MDYVLPGLVALLLLLVAFRTWIKRGFRPLDETTSAQKFARILEEEQKRLEAFGKARLPDGAKEPDAAEEKGSI